MDEIIFRLRGVSALLCSLSMVDENSVVDGFDSACFLLNKEILECISLLQDEVKQGEPVQIRSINYASTELIVICRNYQNKDLRFRQLFYCYKHGYSWQQLGFCFCVRKAYIANIYNKSQILYDNCCACEKIIIDTFVRRYFLFCLIQFRFYLIKEIFIKSKYYRVKRIR